MLTVRTILHAVWNEAVHSRSRAPALERTALEAPASGDNLARQEPREQCVPRQEPRNKDKSWQAAKCNSASWTCLGSACNILLNPRPSHL